jgi:hypothetical protein
VARGGTEKTELTGIGEMMKQQFGSQGFRQGTCDTPTPGEVLFMLRLFVEETPE